MRSVAFTFDVWIKSLGHVTIRAVLDKLYVPVVCEVQCAIKGASGMLHRRLSLLSSIF